MSRHLAIVRDYDELVEAMRSRVRELNISHGTLDHLSGVQSGYASKLLCDPPMKRLGLVSMGPILSALGLELLVVENADIMRQIAHRHDPRRRVLTEGKHSPVEIRLGRRKLRLMASRGGKKRAEKLTPKQREMIARRAAKSRWRRRARARASRRGAKASPNNDPGQIAS